MAMRNHQDRDAASRTVVVVGGGMVGWKLTERLLDLDEHDELRIVLIGEERSLPYDRVHLTEFFDTRSKDCLRLAPPDFFERHGVELRTGDPVTEIRRWERVVRTESGAVYRYDALVLATGSSAFLPPVPGVDADGVFSYRTLEDVEAILERAQRARRCAVVGGGLLGLEAARAVQSCGLETHVVELAPRLMPRQLDEVGAAILRREVEALGVGVHLGKATESIVGSPVEGLRFEDGTTLDVDMVVVSAGIRPRDELARDAGIDVGERGGIVVDDHLCTSADGIYALGEVALHRGTIYGLVAPGHQMADALAMRLLGVEDAGFRGSDLSAKLKLMGVEVATVGDPVGAADDAPCVSLHDRTRGVYKKLVLDEKGERLLGAILVGDASAYPTLLHYAQTGARLPSPPEALLYDASAMGNGAAPLPDTAQVCSCNGITGAIIKEAIREQGLSTMGELKRTTRAGTGCGGCLPQVKELLHGEMAALGKTVNRSLCEHFDHGRQALYDLIRVEGIRTFKELIETHGRGHGCEICKPTVASIFASLHGDMILESHATLQDTNDRFLANIQRRGLYSVVPRIPGGEITARKLVALGEIAEKYELYTKITGGQRVDLFGARLEQLPDIWEELVDAGFESGHAYAKGIRTVKSCVGSTWCRYGVDDSVALAVRIENRYRGIRSPHKLKSAVSGCTRECAEAQSKDFGIIATENGWNLYVGGNGGTKPRHADLLASDLSEEALIQTIDRFLGYYIATADKLTRTSTWLEKIDGGIEHVRDVVVHDSLGIAGELEGRIQHLVDNYRCEWEAVVRDPEQRKRFRHFANSTDEDESVFYIEERGQRRPADWGAPASGVAESKVRLPVVTTEWIDVGSEDDFPRDGGVSVKHGLVQLAVYRFASIDAWYATQNMCPHMEDMVLARGILGDSSGEPKVACPMHKKSFSLETGASLSGDPYSIRTFPVRVSEGRVLVEVPPAEALASELCPGRVHCEAEAAE